MASRSRATPRVGLLRELLESEQHGGLAERWIAHCADLEQALEAARIEFRQLAEWARTRNGVMPPPLGPGARPTGGADSSEPAPAQEPA